MNELATSSRDGVDNAKIAVASGGGLQKRTVDFFEEA